MQAGCGVTSTADRAVKLDMTAVNKWERTVCVGVCVDVYLIPHGDHFIDKHSLVETKT